MSRTSPSAALRRGLRCALLCAAVIALAGCATGYDLVQPQASGSGSYYTGAGPYGSGYVAGSYYPDAGVYGYSSLQPYFFTSAFDFDFGFPGAFGWGYPWGYGFGNLWPASFGGPWGFGYTVPWYSVGIPPVWGACRWRCGRHHRRHGQNWDHAHAGERGADMTASTWLSVDQPHLVRGLHTPEYGMRPEAFSARRISPAMMVERPLVRAPMQRMNMARPIRFDGAEMAGMRPAPTMRSFAPAPAFRSARSMAASRPVRAMPMPTFSPPPAPMPAPSRPVTSRSRVR